MLDFLTGREGGVGSNAASTQLRATGGLEGPPEECVRITKGERGTGDEKDNDLGDITTDVREGRLLIAGEGNDLGDITADVGEGRQLTAGEGNDLGDITTDVREGRLLTALPAEEGDRRWR